MNRSQPSMLARCFLATGPLSPTATGPGSIPRSAGRAEAGRWPVRAPRGLVRLLVLTLALLGLSGCGYNLVIDKDEAVKGAWAEVENQYQRRADLVPNLVNVVKGAANFEKDTLTAVVEARAKVGQVKVDASTIDDPQKLQQFEQAQGQLGSALSRLLVVAEQYPQLKATDAFRDLQVQLEGTENRITVARKRYIETVADYNATVQKVPTNIGAKLRGMNPRPTFSATTPGADRAPSVQF
jgi:LemA protein